MEAWTELHAEWDRFTQDPAAYREDLLQAARPAMEAQPWKAWGCAKTLAVEVAVLRGRGTLCELGAADWAAGIHPDVWVGFRNAGADARRVGIKCGGMVRETVVGPGCCELALGDNCIPFVCLNFEPAWLTADAPARLTVVTAFLPNEARRALVQCPWRAGPLYVSGGFARALPEEGREYLRLPPSWLRPAAAKRRLLEVYLEELMAAACHPSRLFQIGV